MSDIGKYIDTYLSEVTEIVKKLDREQIRGMIKVLSEVKKNDGRIFFIGVGGSAGNASHAVNDFRKIAGIQSYSPTDNVSELTARVNDDGWDSSFVNWLIGSRLNDKDCLFVFSVGGGNLEKNISVNIVNALKHAKDKGSKVIGVVGKDGGYTAQVADACVIIPTINADTITPHAESFQATIWHLLVTHPEIKSFEMKWEGTDKSK